MWAWEWGQAGDLPEEECGENAINMYFKDFMMCVAVRAVYYADNVIMSHLRSPTCTCIGTHSTYVCTTYWIILFKVIISICMLSVKNTYWIDVDSHYIVIQVSFHV